MSLRLAALSLPLLLAACGDAGDDAPVDSDTVDLPDDTFQGDSGEDTPDPVDSDDTGRFYTLQYEGHGRVARGAFFKGIQSLSAVWLKGGVKPGKPRCMYVQSLVDWENDDARTTANPLRDQDPGTTDTLDRCPSCEFAFTVSLLEPAYADGYPSTTYPGFENTQDFVPEKPWLDTDDDDDVVVVDPSTQGPHLSCEVLTGKLGFPAPSSVLDQLGDWRGIGLDVDADGDDDDQTGVVYTVGADGVWAASYDGWWNSATGELFWTGKTPTSEYPVY